MKLAQVTLQMRQVEAIKNFYGDLIGLDTYENHLSRLSFRVGQSILSFTEGSSEEEVFYHIAMAIPANKLQEAKQWVRGRGIALFSKDRMDDFYFDNWKAEALYFYDPDGNLIEFIAHHNADAAVDEPFNSGQLLRISEIGLPVDDVPHAVRQLADTIQAKAWGGDGQQFVPLGDAEGALILVNKNRPWFPDGRLPGIFVTEITINNGQSGCFKLQDGLYRFNCDSPPSTWTSVSG